MYLSSWGKIQFGERSGEMTDRVQAVADYLDECGIANEPCGDILYKQWNKLCLLYTSRSRCRTQRS